MNHLKRFNELNTETYLSAADRLSRNHPERAKALRRWVERDIDIDYISPLPFEIDGDTFYLTKVKLDKELNKYAPVTFRMRSTDDELSGSIFAGGVKDPTDIHSALITGNEIKYGRKKNRNWVDCGNLKFSSRKEAREFIKLIEQETGEKWSNITKLTINDIYKSK